MRTSANRPVSGYLGEGRRRRRRFSRARAWILVLGLTALVASVLLLAQAQASGSGASLDCRSGAISAMGPVDAQGRGQTTPDVRCLTP